MAHALHLMLFVGLPHLWLASGEVVNVGDSVQLTAKQDCGDGREFKLKTDDNRRTVARRVGGEWRPEVGYEGRVEHDSRSALRLTRVNFNDMGLFEFSCGNDVINIIQLTVVVPFDVSVTEGSWAQLPCYFSTAGKTVLRVRWERDGELVLELARASSQAQYGKKFGERASVPHDWYVTGNFSLTFEEVRLEDQGVFTCYIDEGANKKTSGEPKAVRMRVNGRVPAPTTITPPCQPQMQPPRRETMGPWTIISVTLNVLLLLVLVCVGLWMKFPRRNVPPRADGGEGRGGRGVGGLCEMLLRHIS